MALLIAVGMALTISTAMRVSVFQDERLIWQDAVQKAPEKPRPWVNLGRQYALYGEDVAAWHAYVTAIELAQSPGRTHDERVIATAFAYANLGALLRSHDVRLATAYLNNAGAAMPNTPALMRMTSWTGDPLAR